MGEQTTAQSLYYLVSKDTNMSSTEREQERLALLREYHHKLIDLGLPRQLANTAYRIWRAGCFFSGEEAILRRVDEFLSTTQQQNSAA
jgi:hypothetical protein